MAVVAALALAYFTAVRGLHRPSTGTVGPPIGRTLPYFQLEPLTGDSRAVSLADLKGRVTLVNFWGTWCPPCRREFPGIVALAAHFSGQERFRLHAVSCGSGADEDLAELREQTQAFLKSNNTTLPTYSDQNAASRRALALVLDPEEFAYPTTIVLDSVGTIRGYWIGYSPGSEEEMRTLIDELLEQLAAPAS
jgi:cytochrome c biogenesis protein CcmG/thiol:disulfide interchange protein DsbE